MGVESNIQLNLDDDDGDTNGESTKQSINFLPFLNCEGHHNVLPYLVWNRRLQYLIHVQ